MKLKPAADNEIERVVEELERGKSRPKSGDFLHGFPWKSTRWYQAVLEYTEFENLFLFWTGSAWDEIGHMLPRRLKDGVASFVRIDLLQSDNIHLKEVKHWLSKCEVGEFRYSDPFFILGGQDQDSRLVILDGNHRAVAILWWMSRGENWGKTPLVGWLGLSPDMGEYQPYRRVLQVG